MYNKTLLALLLTRIRFDFEFAVPVAEWMPQPLPDDFG
jgi:hypothetical protein